MGDAFKALGAIDAVVNNAGYGVFASVEEATDDQIQRVINTNLLGSIHVIRAALPHLRAQGHGRIVQVSTASGQTTYPNFSYYHASKWGIEGFCETVAREIAPFGIGLTIVEPGATQTGFAGALDTAPVMPEYENTPAGEVRRAIPGDRGSGDGPLRKLRRLHRVRAAPSLPVPAGDGGRGHRSQSRTRTRVSATSGARSQPVLMPEFRWRARPKPPDCSVPACTARSAS
ncbi:SDR family NAD(P)-dependent oxidoreductase [Streptomyces collinus]|uniref:SDR family NAD(P)-dependent oxidoreductase n=1 Tax=Streptomyces collinus TaxID=42684 RepID=UPI0036C34A91